MAAIGIIDALGESAQPDAAAWWTWQVAAMLSLQGVEVSMLDLERRLTEQLLDPIDKDLWQAGELPGVADLAAHDDVVPLRPGPLSISVDLIVGPLRRVGATDVPEVDAALARRLERRPTTLTLLALGTVWHAARYRRVLETCDRIVLLTSKSVASIRVVRQVGRSLLTLTTADWCYATIDTPTIGSYLDDATYAAPRLVAAFRASLTSASGTEVERPEGDPSCLGVVLHRVPQRDKSTPVFLSRPAAAGHGLTNHGIRSARREFATVASRLARWSGIDWPSSDEHLQQGSSASRPDRVPRFCTTAAAEREAQMGLQSGYLTDPEDDAGVGRYLRYERLEDVLDSEHSVIVIGEPGIGKSHEYRRLLERLAARHERFEHVDLAKGPFRRHTTSGAPLIIFDGLDESTDHESFDFALDLGRWLAGAGRPRIILFSRAIPGLDRVRATLRSVDLRFTTVRLLPLRRIDVHQLAVAQGMEASDADALLRAIRDADVEGLAARPMTLDPLVQAFLGGERLTASRVDLFDRATRALLDPGDPRIFEVAAALAWCLVVGGVNAVAGPERAYSGAGWYTRDGVRHLSASAFLRHSAAALGCDDRILQHVLASRLFEPVAAAVWRPVHRSFAEFLAARHGYRRSLFDDLEGLVPAGLPPERLVGMLIWWAQMDAGVARRLVDRDPMALLQSRATLAPSVRPVLLDALVHRHRAGAVALHHHLLHPLVISPDEDPTAARALTERLIGLLESDPDLADVAAVLLPVTDPDVAVDRLGKVATDAGVEPELRRTAIESLCRAGLPIPIDALRRSLRGPLPDDASGGLRGAILRALWPDHIDALDAIRCVRPVTRDADFDYEQFVDGQARMLADALDEDALVFTIDWASENVWFDRTPMCLAEASPLVVALLRRGFERVDSQPVARAVGRFLVSTFDAGQAPLLQNAAVDWQCPEAWLEWLFEGWIQSIAAHTAVQPAAQALAELPGFPMLSAERFAARAAASPSRAEATAWWLTCEALYFVVDDALLPRIQAAVPTVPELGRLVERSQAQMKPWSRRPTRQQPLPPSNWSQLAELLDHPGDDSDKWNRLFGLVARLGANPKLQPLAKSEVWRRLPERQQTRAREIACRHIIEGAKASTLAPSSDAARWLAAWRLLLDTQSLPQDDALWRPWAPVLLADQGPDPDGKLFDVAFERLGASMVEALSLVLHHASWSSANAVERLLDRNQHTVVETTLAYLDSLTTPGDEPPDGSQRRRTQRLVEVLLTHPASRARARQWVADRAPVGGWLLEGAFRVDAAWAWALFWPRAAQDDDFARTCIEAVLHGSGPWWSTMPAEQLGRVAISMRGIYPRRDGPNGVVYRTETGDGLDRLLTAIVRDLVDRGEVDVLLKLMPVLGFGSPTVDAARRRAKDRSWRPAVGELLDSTYPLETSRDLLRHVLKALRHIQREALDGGLSLHESFFRPQPDGTVVRATEKPACRLLAYLLWRRLNHDAVHQPVLEPEGFGGKDRPDILIAGRRPGAQVIIEVKWIDHRALWNEFDSKLVDRYLARDADAAGIYLVLWTDQIRGTLAANRQDPAAVQARLEALAAARNREGVTVAPFVLRITPPPPP